MKYKIFYADESVYEGDWQDAPGWGVQVITTDERIRHQGSYYRLEDDEPVAMDYDDLLYYIVEELRLVKVGYMLGTKKWKKVFRQASEEFFS